MSAPTDSVRGTPPAAGPLAFALGTAATATTLVSCWLTFTVFTVLPSRDPAHVPMWAAVAAGFLLFALASFAAVFPGPLQSGARVLSGSLGVAATGLGAGSVVRTLTSAGSGRHFEGYLVLMGLVLGVHGLLALAHAFSATAAPRR